MEILGIGPSELIFVIVIALIVLGPRDMQKAGRTVGRWLNSIIRSDGWKAFQQTSREIRSLPNRLMREANIEMMEAEKQVRKTLQDEEKRISSSLNSNLTQSQQASNSAQTSDTSQPASDETTPNEKTS